MPPKRRSAVAATSSRDQSQSRLSFNNKSRVTKQSNSLPPSELKSKPAKRLSDQAKEQVTEQLSQQKDDVQKTAPATEEIKLDIEVSGSTSASPIPQARKKKNKNKTNSAYDRKFQEAEKISDAKVKAYWKAEEDSRLAPRIHQKDVHIHEKILRHFDLSSQYGPCIGVSRLERWKRACGLGLEPPVEVLAVLLKEEKKGADRGEGGRQCGRLAYIDELAGGRVVLVE